MRAISALALWAVAGLGSASAVWPVQPVPLPDLSAVSAENPAGEAYALQRALSRRFTVLVFIRGAWCPFSVQLLKELRNHEGAILAKGFQIIALTPDRPFRVREMLEELDLPYVVVTDRASTAARAFGVAPMLTEDESARYGRAAALPAPLPGEPRSRLPRPSVAVLTENGKCTTLAVGLVEQMKFSAPDLLRACDDARRIGRLGE